MTQEARDFNREAAKWDENPGRVRVAGEVGAAMIARVQPNKTMHAADFGCGTGLLTLQLQPLVASVTGFDSSKGMLSVLQAKIADSNLKNIETRLIDIDKGENVSGTYDLIVSSMTLHHIRDPKSLLQQLAAALRPGGILAVADLDPDDGKFHDDNTGVFHFGFPRQQIAAMFGEAGLSAVESGTATEIVKPQADGTKRIFSVFLVSGQRS
jgi:2-polyprenyl-3-methyl-5-hydroxy-6-metoxy-1,4-benzoquinol methylase